MTYLHFVLLVSLLAIVILFIDYRGPKIIHLKHDKVFGLECLRAKELIVQESDKNGNLWASRGMVIYCLKSGDNKFIRIAHVPTGLSIFWFNNLKFFRWIMLRSECIEITLSQDASIHAFSAGRMWIKSTKDNRFRKTMKLPNFGRGVGRGIMSTGILSPDNYSCYFGEYFRNNEKTNRISIYKYNIIKNQWKIVYTFLPGQIRHIHALQSDPFTGKLWICTGDEDNEAMIGWSDDDFKTINPIGKGSQAWRTCQLVFTEDSVYWGTDSGSLDLAGIYCWNKKIMNVERIYKTDGAVFFATMLKNGLIVMSTDRERFPNEKDESTRLFIIDKENRVKEIICGEWDYKKPGFRFNFAKLRLQRNQFNDLLAVSVLNQKKFSDGEILLIHENVIQSN